MFAVVRTGGKQYRIAADQKILVDRLPGEAGDTVTLDVLLTGEAGDLKSEAGQTVTAEIVAQTKGDKIIVFKKKRRHNYRRKNGHRQDHTLLKIVAIGGEAPKKAAAKKAEPKAEAAPAVAAEAPAAPAPEKAAGPKKAAAPKVEAAAETTEKKPAKPKAAKAKPAAE